MMGSRPDIQAFNVRKILPRSQLPHAWEKFCKFYKISFEE